MLSVHSLVRVRTIFLQAVTLTFAVAFYSLYIQLPGLYGDNGILPARSQIDISRAEKEPLIKLLIESPTLLWLSPYFGISVMSMMDILCLIGTIVGLMVTLFSSFITTPVMFFLWLAYFSLFQVGQTFLSFQWDILLLETGFLALLAAPLTWHHDTTPLARDHVTMYMVRWLLFRMMFASGVVKLTSGCSAWWGLTAMPTHYFSQCIPTPLAWYATLMPDWMHKLSVVSTYIIEMPLSFLFFAPTSSLRKFTFFNQVFLMVVIMLSGNYNFFNFLYIALCLSLADDSWLSSNKYKKTSSHPLLSCTCCILHLAVFSLFGWAVAQAFNLRLTENFIIESSVNFSRKQFDYFLSMAVPSSIYIGCFGLALAAMISVWKAIKTSSTLLTMLSSMTGVLLYTLVAIGIFGISLPSYTGQLDRATYDKIPAIFKMYDRKLDSLRLTSSYGLFRSMTGIGGRPEVIVEGSDNLHGPWNEYQFRYKPGNLSTAPMFVLPHQPRLDWQMWFAALGSFQNNPWFVSMAYKLLEGREEVLDLLHPSSPFLISPPKYIRAKLYKYLFTGLGETGWWKRVEEGEYLPILTLDHKPLTDFLKGQGLIDLPREKLVHEPSVSNVLSIIRRLTRTGPDHHIQIWSFAWIYLPIMKSFLF